MTDVSKMTDQELMAFLNSGQQVQPVNADTGQPLNPAQARGVAQYAAAGGFDPHAQPGTPRKPFAQTAPGDLPGEGQYYFDTEGNVQRAPHRDVGRAALGAVNDRTRALARGVPIAGAFADEADAATAAALAPIIEPAARRLPPFLQALVGYDPQMEIGNLPTFGQRYDAAKNLQRFSDQRFDAAHPKESMVEQGIGAVGGTVAALPLLGGATAAAGPEAGLLVRSGAGMVEGAGVGAAHGYGLGEGGLTDPSRIHAAETGAMLGAAAGAALPIASRVAGTVYRGTAGRLVDALKGQREVQAPVQATADRLAKVLRGDALTDGAPSGSVPPAAAAMKPDRSDVESALVSARRSPLVTRASNVDDAYIRLARAAERQKMTPQEMASAAREIGPFGTLADTGEASRDLLRAAVNRPGRGATIARENLAPRQEGVFDPESGTWTVRPSSARVTDQAQTGMGLDGKDFHSEIDNLLSARKAAADPLYTKLREGAPVDIGELRDFAGSPDFKAAYDRARTISQREFVTQPDGSMRIEPLPEKFSSNEAVNWRTLDLMKQGLDDMVTEGKTQGFGSNANKSIKDYRDAFRDKLDSLNPDYKAARDAYAGPTAMKEALEEGRNLLKEDAPVVASTLASRSESERQMMRLGALQALQTKLGNANVTYDAANQAGLLKPNQLARFKALFPDAKSFADFYRTMQNERTMFGTNAAAFGNSTTAKQLLNVMEPSDPQLEGMAQAIPAAAGMNPIALIKAIHRMGMESPMREGVAETIASVLSSHDQEALPQIVAKMTEAQKAARIADLLRNSMGTGSGQAAARAAQPGQ